MHAHSTCPIFGQHAIARPPRNFAHLAVAPQLQLGNFTMHTKLSELMWQYEGNAPHSIKEAFIEGGSPTCAHCGACIGDHTPVGHDISLSYYEYQATVKVTIRGMDGRVSNDGYTMGMSISLVDEDVNY